MIKSDRRARMMLGCAMDGGDLAVADLVQHLGAEGAWAKITEGALGEPAAERAARVSVDVIERLAKAAALRFVAPAMTSGRMGLMIFAMPRASSGVAGSRWDCGYAVLGIWLI
jgi:hypothetical protein